MKDAAQRGRIEGAVQLAGRSVPEHDPCMTTEESTTARWIILRVDFEERGNRRSQVEIDLNSTHIQHLL